MDHVVDSPLGTGYRVTGYRESAEVFVVILLGEAVNQPLFMLSDPVQKIVSHSHIKSSTKAGQDVDVPAFLVSLHANLFLAIGFPRYASG
jgi:hypothetical protein